MQQLVPFALTAFVTLLVVIDPIAIVPMFVGLTGSRSPTQRREIFRRSVITAFGIALFFLVGGRFLLGELGVSVNAFKISGGILLFITAMPMLFGHRGALMSPGAGEDVMPENDIAVFPLAIPLISGPGTLTTLLTLDAAAKGSMQREAVLAGALVIVFAITAVVLHLGGAVMQTLRASGVHVVTRVLGIVLAALAAQFVLSGISGFVHEIR